MNNSFFNIPTGLDFTQLAQLNGTTTSSPSVSNQWPPTQQYDGFRLQNPSFNQFSSNQRPPQQLFTNQLPYQTQNTGFRIPQQQPAIWNQRPPQQLMMQHPAFQPGYGYPYQMPYQNPPMTSTLGSGRPPQPWMMPPQMPFENGYAYPTTYQTPTPGVRLEPWCPPQQQLPTPPQQNRGWQQQQYERPPQPQETIEISDDEEDEQQQQQQLLTPTSVSPKRVTLKTMGRTPSWMTPSGNMALQTAIDSSVLPMKLEAAGRHEEKKARQAAHDAHMKSIVFKRETDGKRVKGKKAAPQQHKAVSAASKKPSERAQKRKQDEQNLAQKPETSAAKRIKKTATQEAMYTENMGSDIIPDRHQAENTLPPPSKAAIRRCPIGFPLDKTRWTPSIIGFGEFYSERRAFIIAKYDKTSVEYKKTVRDEAYWNIDSLNNVNFPPDGLDDLFSDDDMGNGGHPDELSANDGADNGVRPDNTNVDGSPELQEDAIANIDDTENDLESLEDVFERELGAHEEPEDFDEESEVSEEE